MYEDINLKPKINPNLYKIFTPYCLKTKPKAKKNISLENNCDSEEEIEFIKKNYYQFNKELKETNCVVSKLVQSKNTAALNTADFVYEESGKYLISDAVGSNIGPPVDKMINNSRFFFPRNSIFFVKNVESISLYLEGKTFDLILLDPPWYNKYIRRKRKKSPHAYNMMANEELKNIPLENMLTDNGLIVVWCTNSPKHITYLKDIVFKKWKVGYISTWYWVKVTKSGETVCDFSKPNGKQPFERIIIGSRNNCLPKEKKLIVSVPSAIHSHKPILHQIFKKIISKDPKCLEIFARNLLPHWTSYGNETLRFQHESLYCVENK
ncbi:N(6)-adenine-specific methyltransferase METTL4 isoform X2 [Cylas formicarius]|nr:N(6)-adenine-specific methyltransferase METTL4 isoform X2 [Cylas formicarius]